MIIRDIKVIRTRDVAHYSWVKIGRFHNLEHTTSVIMNLHKLGVRQRDNAKRQAEQIKYCLGQAKEYYDAAKAVSLATRPVLLYYSAMSMGLSEILLKQTADSRLSILRERHNCHGLQLSLLAEPKYQDGLKSAANKLIAKSQVDLASNPRGTFEVWRRSAREYPAGGYNSRIFDNGTSQRSYLSIFLPDDAPPPMLPASGISLFECFQELPYMLESLSNFGEQIRMVRATITSTTVHQSSESFMTLIVHPANQQLIDDFGSLVIVHPGAVNTLQFSETPSGYIIKDKLDAHGIIQLPHSVSLSDEDIYFSCSRKNLGEFGFLYIALHICGNFARYYPDIWLKHIEKNSPLAMAIDELCTACFERLPLLTSSELERAYYVIAK